MRLGVEAWLGAVPVSLHAEHGYWSRLRDGTGWVSHGQPGAEWQGAVRDRVDRMLSGEDPWAALPGN